MLWFPVVGAALGAVLGLVELGARTLTRSDALACGLVVVLGFVLTGGRPLRGVMVLAGALFGGRDSESLAQLAAGPLPTRFGLLAGLAVLLLKYALLMALPRDSRFGALLVTGGLSRAAIVWACWRFPYADIDTGIGGWFTALAGARDLLLLLPVVAVGFGLLNPLLVPAAIAGAWLLAHGFAWWISRALTGLTAHACEATAEVAELGALGAVAGLVHFALW